MFEDDMKERVEGCPKTYDSKHEICKDCSLAGDCRRHRLEEIAMNPEEMGHMMALAQVEASEIMEKKAQESLKNAIDKEVGRAHLGYGRIAFPPPVGEAEITAFLQLADRFYKLAENLGWMPNQVPALFDTFLKTPFHLYKKITE